MTLYEENLKKTSNYGYWAIAAHIPIFMAMAYYFKTQYSIALGIPVLILGMHFLLNSIKSSYQFNSILFGFSSIVLSGVMIHLGKGMIEWHFHIFVTLGVLCLFANPYTIVAAAATAAVHHLAFYFLLPESVFNYEASLGIVVIHAGFVVVEALACTFISFKFKKILELQDRINNEISPLIQSIESASKSSSLTANYLSQASDENSSAITEISATANEITAMVKRTKDLIHKSLQTLIESNKSVSDSSDAVSQGEQFLMSLNELKYKMEKLNSFSEKQLGTVVDAVSLISDKTQVINDIVFQTKLLSFNASVEAARAGEYGKGFSVVAEEVGKLAQSSGEASQEIAHIVDQSKVDLEESVKSITNELQRFGDEVKVACDNWNVINNQLQSSFEVVEKSAGDQESSLQEITTAADNQTEGVQELAQALDSIETSISSSMKQIKELTNTSNHLAQDSLKLNKLHEEISIQEAKNVDNVVEFPTKCENNFEKAS